MDLTSTDHHHRRIFARHAGLLRMIQVLRIPQQQRDQQKAKACRCRGVAGVQGTEACDDLLEVLTKRRSWRIIKDYP